MKKLLLIVGGLALILSPMVTFLTLWVLSIIYALILLRKSKLDATALALWTIFVVSIPVAGSLAFYIVNPCDDPNQDAASTYLNQRFSTMKKYITPSIQAD